MNEFLSEFRAMCSRFRDQRRWRLAQPVVMVLLFRDSRSPFSISYDEDMLAFDVMHTPFDDPVWMEFRAEFINMAIGKHSARAHLCKTSGTVSREQALRHVRDEHLEEFKKRIDPRLLNPYFSELFEMPAQQQRSANDTEAAAR